jgi:hypothetical protein
MRARPASARLFVNRKRERIPGGPVHESRAASASPYRGFRWWNRSLAAISILTVARLIQFVPQIITRDRHTYVCDKADQQTQPEQRKV